MELIRVSSLPARLVLWQQGAGEWTLTVACKLTYALEPGVSRLAGAQLELNPTDKHVDNDSGRSVYAPSDLAPSKPRADVVVTGSAFAPGGAPIKRLVAGLIVADINKTISVSGWRAVGPDGNVQDGGPFASMPLSYEQASGGPGTDNPVGVNADSRDSYGRTLLPSLHKEDAALSSDNAAEPIGFGPIAHSWPQRRKRLGPHEADFDASNWRANPLPPGFDMGYFNVAPLDQQVPAIKANEAMVLQNLHPDHPTFITKLEGIVPAVFLAERDGERLTMAPDTLWIDTDRAIATLTFRGSVAVRDPKEHLRVVVAKELPGRPVSWAQVKERLPKRERRSTLHTIDLPIEEGTSVGFLIPGARAPLPFTSSLHSGAVRQAEGRAGQDDGALPFSAKRPAAQPPSDPLASTAQNWHLTRTPAAAAISLPKPLIPPPPPSAPTIPPPPPSAPGSNSRQSVGPSPWVDGSATVPPIERRMPLVPMVADPLKAAAPKGVIRSTPLPTPAKQTGTANEPLALLWLHPDCAARVRRIKTFAPIFEEMERRPVDWDLDDAAPEQDPTQLEDRREVFEVLVRGPRVDGQGVRRAIKESVRKDGKFVPPVVLVAAELATLFDERERLKALITTVTPLTPSDDDESPLSKALSDAKTFLDSADELCPASVLAGFSKRIIDAFADKSRTLPDSYLDDETDRVLLENRKYDKRIVFGEPHLRTMSQLDHSGPPVVTYLPEELAAALPMYARFKVRLIAEALHQEDQYEAHPIALRALALARVLPALTD